MAPLVPGAQIQGPDIEIDGGRIRVPRHAPQWNSDAYGKNDGVWRSEALLTRHTSSGSGDERISINDVGPGAGKVGLLAYEAAADFDDFLAHQPWRLP